MCAGGFLFVFWEKVEKHHLVIWFVILLLVVIIRTVIGVKYKQREKNIDDLNKWSILYTSGSFCSSLLWSASIIILFLPEQPVYVLFLVCIFTGLISGAVSAAAIHMPTVYAYVLPFTLCLVVLLLIESEPIYFSMGFLTLLYLTASLVFANKTSKMLKDSISLRFENNRLLRDYKHEKNRAEEAVIAKSNFLAAASHDLRQPVQSQALFYELLQNHITDKEGENILIHLRKSSNELSGLFNGILDISKLDANTVDVNLSHVELDDLLSTIIERSALQAKDLGLIFEVEIVDIVCHTDPYLLQRIIENLLSNAFKYTEKGRIKLAAIKNSTHAKVSISDTGIGIPNSEIDYIFSEYYQLDNPARDRTKGLGLGLAIVKRLCDLLNTQIIVDTEITKGSTFSLYVPIGNRSETQSITNNIDTSHTNFNGLNVFVVDDDKEILIATKGVLEKWGFICSCFNSFESAIVHANQLLSLPDILISDYRLENGKTGVDLIDDIRQIYKKNIPAILITGDTASNKLKNMSNSKIRVMHKPIMPGQLRVAIRQEINNLD